MDYRSALNRAIRPSARPIDVSRGESSTVQTAEFPGIAWAEHAGQASGVVTCEQAVFTSAPSPMGAGYRIVSASPGLKADERTEITRRSPSHNGLCSRQIDAVGMMAYVLPSGRYCISHSHYAGAEHTARGGQRVYTHAIVIDTDAYRQAGANPVRLHAGLRSCTHTIDLSRRHFDPLATIDVPIMRPALRPSRLSGERLGQFVQLLAATMGERSWIVVGLSQSVSLLEGLVDVIPLSARAALSLSVGVSYTLTRQVRLAFLEGDCREAQRATRGHDVRWWQPGDGQLIDWEDGAEWLAVVRDYAAAGRISRISQIAERLVAPTPAPTLNRLARLLRDLDRVERADEQLLAELHEKYASAPALSTEEGEFIAQIQSRVAARFAEISERNQSRDREGAY